MATHSRILPGESHGQKRLVGYSPWGPPPKKKEYWSGLPFPSPGDLSNPGIEPGSPALEALTSEPPGKPYIHTYIYIKLFTHEILGKSMTASVTQFVVNYLKNMATPSTY